MKLRWMHVVCFGLVAAGAAVVEAAESYLQFAQGLRDRRYYDYALLYLDQVEAKSSVPADIKAVIPFEKAITLLESARTLQNAELQNQQLDQAQAYLEQFTKANPNHPKAAQANSERAKVFLERARVEIWQSRSPANQGTRGEYQQRARDLIAQARAIFQAAHDQYMAAYDTFDKFIPPEDKERYQARQTAEVSYMRAQLDLAMCTYEEAQTYDKKDPKAKELSVKAADEFEQIHSKYRSQVGGLYARMWQAKCFEEQDDIRKALGIYNELLDHPGTSLTMQRLQDQVRQFRLICLNHESRNDFQLVIQEAAEWLKNPPSRTRTPIGLGIRWQQALAYEQMGLKRELPKPEQERYLRLALNEADVINRYPGEYKDVSMFMKRRIQVALRGEAGDPEDFDTAFGIAGNMQKQISELQQKVDAAKEREEKQKAQQDLDLHLNEMGRILNLALSLADAKTDIGAVNQARYLLSYVYYLNKQSYESAILSEYVSRHYYQKDKDTALETAYLAMAAYVQAYNAAPESQKDVDRKLMARICNFIASKWPESDKANDARMTLGRIYAQMQQPAEAAKWFSDVPTTAPQYADAQLAAGQAYWEAYLQAAPLPDDEKPPVAELQKWQTAAEEHLKTGVSKVQERVPEGTEAPPELTAAKVSLAQILINQGKYDESIELLTGGTHSVIQAIQVEDDGDRPERGIKSPAFAGLAYQLLLRCYVGTKQIDKAIEAMNNLETVAGAAGNEAITQIYVQLGKELENELKRLKGLGEDDRLAEVRSSFESFLNELFNRKDGQTYGSLIWIAETYYGLGQGVEEDAAAAAYFEKAAATYQDILDRAAKEQGFVDAARLTGVQLRMVNCKRRQGDFEEALEIATGILKEKSQALDAQFEAASTLQDWGTSGRPDAHKKLLDAINGDKEKSIWGWGHIALRLQRYLDSGSGSADFTERFYQSRYNISLCRHKYGMAQSSKAKRDEELEKARQEIYSFAVISCDIPQDWWSKYEALYQQVLKDMGQPVEKLPKCEPIPAAKPEPTLVTTATDAGPDGPAPPTPPVRESSGPSTALVLILVLVAGGAVFGMVFFMGGKKRRPRRTYGVSPETTSGRTVKPKSKRPKPKSDSGVPGKVRAGEATATASATAAVKKRNPGEEAPVKKKKVRPPGTNPPA